MKVRSVIAVILLILGIGLLLFTGLSGSDAEPQTVEPIDPDEPVMPQAPPPPGSNSSGFVSITGWILTLSGCILIVINFARSVSSTAPESRAMQIQVYIEEHPGCSESDIVKNLGYSRGSTAHHINRLLRETRIVEKPYRNSIHYYSPVTRTEEDVVRNAISTKEKPSAILNALEGGALTLSELAEKTGYTTSSLRWHLSRLAEDGVVVVEKEGKSVRYSLHK